MPHLLHFALIARQNQLYLKKLHILEIFTLNLQILESRKLHTCATDCILDPLFWHQSFGEFY